MMFYSVSKYFPLASIFKVKLKIPDFERGKTIILTGEKLIYGQAPYEDY